MLKIKRFTEYGYAQEGVVYNSNSYVPILWGKSEHDVLQQFNEWRGTIKKENIISITGPIREVIEPGCGMAVITVMYEEEQ